MKLYIKQKVFSLGEKFSVKDEFGNDKFYVEGSFFSIPKNFTIYDDKQKVVARIDKQMFKLFPHYNIKTSNDELVIKENFSFLRLNFSILNSNWRLQGDFLSHEYSIIDGNRPMMRLSKHWFTWGDSYELNIADPSEAIICLCIAVVVDAAIVASQNNN